MKLVGRITNEQCAVASTDEFQNNRQIHVEIICQRSLASLGKTIEFSSILNTRTTLEIFLRGNFCYNTKKMYQFSSFKPEEEE